MRLERRAGSPHFSADPFVLHNAARTGPLVAVIETDQEAGQDPFLIA
jgi:hypothetical protein